MASKCKRPASCLKLTNEWYDVHPGYRHCHNLQIVVGCRVPFVGLASTVRSGIVQYHTMENTCSMVTLVTAVFAWPCQTGSPVSLTVTVQASGVCMLVLLLRDSKRVPKKSKIKLLLVAAQHSQKYRCVQVPGRQLITFIYCFHEISNSSPYSPAALLSRTPNHIHYLF